MRRSQSAIQPHGSAATVRHLPPAWWAGGRIELYTAAGLTWDRTTDAALSLPTLKRQISQRKYCAKKAFRVLPGTGPAGGGHMMVARGFQTVAIPES